MVIDVYISVLSLRRILWELKLKVATNLSFTQPQDWGANLSFHLGPGQCPYLGLQHKLDSIKCVLSQKTKVADMVEVEILPPNQGVVVCRGQMYST